MSADEATAEKAEALEHWRRQFPLRASGCRLQNARGERFKLAAVNWYGASDCYHVVAGLDCQELKRICETVAAIGFTAVRLPFSNEMLDCKEVEKGAIDYNKNPSLRGLTPLEVYDQVVDALGNVGVAVVLNNHTTVGMWSGGAEDNGMWFRHGCIKYTEMRWIKDWLRLAERYKDKPHVIAYDLRNEVRPISYLGGKPNPAWGDGLNADWSRAAGNCARSLVLKGCEGMIIVERICWPQNSLDDMLRPRPPWQAWDVPRDRLMLSLHMYWWSGPGAWSPKQFVGAIKPFFQAVDYIGNRALYGELSERDLFAQMDKEWGFCLDQNTCPVWLSEFGADALNDAEMQWFECTCRYLAHKDADFAYWPLNVGMKPGGGGRESYGFLADDWTPRWSDPRLRALRELLPVPPAKLPAAPQGDVGRPLCLQARLPTLQRLRASCGLAERLRPCGQGPRWGTSSQQPVVVALEPYPWCGALPGPLLPWPDSKSGESLLIEESALRPLRQGDNPQAAPAEAPLSPSDVCPARYLWDALHCKDAEPGHNSHVATGDIGKLKSVCIQGGHGGFVLFQNKGFMRRASAEELHDRAEEASSGSVLFLPQEIRLCALWSVTSEAFAEEEANSVDDCEASSEIVEHQLPEGGPSAVEWCQRACIAHQLSGFELQSDRPGWVRLHPAAAKRPSSSATRNHPLKSGTNMENDIDKRSTREMHKLQPTLVHIGLKAYTGRDVFPGCDAAVQRGINLAQCRERCLQEGFGGFVVSHGQVYFRTAAGHVLEEHLIASGEEVTTYILYAKEATSASLLRSSEPCAREELLQKALPRLWSPPAAAT